MHKQLAQTALLALAALFVLGSAATAQDDAGWGKIMNKVNKQRQDVNKKIQEASKEKGGKKKDEKSRGCAHGNGCTCKGGPKAGNGGGVSVVSNPPTTFHSQARRGSCLLDLVSRTYQYGSLGR